MKRALFAILAILYFSVMLLAACSNTPENEAGEEAARAEKSQHSAETEENSAFPVTVTDAIGEEMTFEKAPERIVSLIPSNTEIAYALGLGEQIVGVSDYDNYPEEVLEKEKVGGLELNVEAILGLEPDLVLAHESGLNSTQEALEQIKDADIPVFVAADAQDIESTYGVIEQIGAITGKTSEADEVILTMKEQFAELEELTAEIPEEEQKAVFFEVSPAPDIYTAGTNTFFDELLRIIHAKNAAAELDGWVQIDPEKVVELNPDVIVTTYGFYEEDATGGVLRREGWESITAVKNEDVYDVHSDIVSRPGPRLAEGAKELAQVVYPELFKE